MVVDNPFIKSLLLGGKCSKTRIHSLLPWGKCSKTRIHSEITPLYFWVVVMMTMIMIIILMVIIMIRMIIMTMMMMMMMMMMLVVSIPGFLTAYYPSVPSPRAFFGLLVGKNKSKRSPSAWVCLR